MFGSQKAKPSASGSSFYLGMRLLPRREREAMFAIYAFSRAVDDVADEGDAPRSERREELNRWRADIEAVYEGLRPDRAAFLCPVVARYGLRKEDFLAVIDGMQMDVDEDICAPDLATLTFIASAWRPPSDACRSESSAWMSPASSLRIIWEGRYSSRISCAISTRIRGPAPLSAAGVLARGGN